MQRMRHIRVMVAMTLFGLFACSESARACAVCFGDPESGMAKGAVAGVIVLVGVVGFVLFGIAGTGLFWLHRSRRLAQVEADPCLHDGSIASLGDDPAQSPGIQKPVGREE